MQNCATVFSGWEKSSGKTRRKEDEVEKQFRPNLFLVALLVVCFAGGAKTDAEISDFFGSYTGFGFATDCTGPFIRTERDFGLAMVPWRVVASRSRGPRSNGREATRTRWCQRYRNIGRDFDHPTSPACSSVSTEKRLGGDAERLFLGGLGDGESFGRAGGGTGGVGKRGVGG